MLTTAELFDVSLLPSELQPLLATEFPWEVLARLDAFGATVSHELSGEIHSSAILNGPVYVAPGATIGPFALIEGPAYIGEGATVAHGAYLRGPVVLAPGAKVGHASEIKRSVLLGGAAAPHFNYAGDSVLGAKVNIGAGVKLANFRGLPGTIKVSGVDTGLRKFGAALGDGVMLGCNSVTGPGTVIGPRSAAYHGSMLRGLYPADTVIKLRQDLEAAPLH